MRAVVYLSKQRLLVLLIILIFLVSLFREIYVRKYLPAGSDYKRVEAYPTLIYLPEYTSGPKISASAAILVEAVSGMILYAKNEHSRRAPASTTKILTAIVTLEVGNLQDVVTVSKQAAATGGSSLWLKTGDRIRLGELLKGTLLRSGNDGCVAIAQHLAGTEKAFVELMNRKAKEVGALNTNFRNTHGLRAPSHYTTAFDLAQITRYAMNNTEFARIVSSKEESIEWYEGKKTANVRNTNRLLWSFAGADGVKTGTTNEAGHCLVASATRDGRKFIAVVLNSPNRWGEAASLLEYGFNSFSLHLLAKADQPVTDLRIPSGWPNRVQVYPRENLMAVLPRTKEGFAQRSITLDPQLMVPPVRPGTVVGKVSFKYKGEEVDAVDLIILERVEKDTWWHRLWRRGR